MSFTTSYIIPEKIYKEKFEKKGKKKKQLPKRKKKESIISISNAG